MLSARTYTLMPYLLGLFGMYCLKLHIPLNPWRDSSIVQPVPGVEFASRAVTNLLYMLQIGANLSSALRWALVVESSKRKQKRFWLIAATQIGLPVPSFAQMLAVLSLELYVAPKTSRMPMSARISVMLVLYRNPGLLV